jgi:hypothetical protein
MLVAQDHLENSWVIPMTDILQDIAHELTVADVSLPTSREVLLGMRAKQSRKFQQSMKQIEAKPEHWEQLSSSSAFDIIQAQWAKRQAEGRPSQSKKEALTIPGKQDERVSHSQFVLASEPTKPFSTPRNNFEGKLDDMSREERRARMLEAELVAQENVEYEARVRRTRKAVIPQQDIEWQSAHRTTDAESLEKRPRRSHKTERTKSKETGKEKLTRMVRKHAALQRELGIRRLSDLSQADTLINTPTPSEGSSGQRSRPNTAHLSLADSVFLSFDGIDADHAEEARDESKITRVGLEPEAQAHISTLSEIRTPRMIMNARRQRDEMKEEQQKIAEVSVNWIVSQQERRSEPLLPRQLERQIDVSSADSLYSQ